MSYWFRRFVRHCRKLSPYIEVVPLKHKFCRIYWRGGGKCAYLYEVPMDMEEFGREWTHYNPRLESQQFYEEYEDNIDVIKQVKNFKEGYWEAIDRINTKFFLLRNNEEFRKSAEQMYKNVHVK